MSLEIITTPQFDRDIKLLRRRGKDVEKLKNVLELLSSTMLLPRKFRNHKLKGNFVGTWECHIEPDWLLIYWPLQGSIKLIRTGTHSDLFK